MLDDVEVGPLRRLALAGVVVGVVAAAGASVAGFVLAEIVRPNAPWVWADLPGLPPTVQRSDRWTDWHQFASGLLLASAAISVALLLWLVYGVKRVLKRKAVAIAVSHARAAKGRLDPRQLLQPRAGHNFGVQAE